MQLKVGNVVRTVAADYVVAPGVHTVEILVTLTRAEFAGGVSPRVVGKSQWLGGTLRIYAAPK